MTHSRLPHAERADDALAAAGRLPCPDDTCLRVLHGTDAPIPELRELRAGSARMLLDGIDLRYVEIGRTEIVRRLYVAVRDCNWNTVPGVVSGLELEERDDSFELRFVARHQAPEIDFSWRGTISGGRDGRITYDLRGVAECDTRYNRIGICIHHPWRETAGAPFSARTPGGVVKGAFPDLVGPQIVMDGTVNALVPAFDRLDVALPGGGSVELELEGDLWETEDHRNWTDANFKTYSTPLALGFPHELARGATLRQRISVVASGVDERAPGEGAIRVVIGRPTGTTVPAIGLGVDGDGHEPSEREAELLRVMAPAHLRVEVRLDQDGWMDVLGHAQRIARRLGAHLLVSLHLRPEHADRLPAVARALSAGPEVDYVLVIFLDGKSSTPVETTPAELVNLVRAALGPVLPGAAVGGGTEMYFTEINRTRPRVDGWDVVCYSITPQIHAFTDIDLVETLDAQAETVRSAKALAPCKQIVVSPITLRRRVNFHATAPDRSPAPGELPDAVDVRQSSLLGAAWTAGSLKYLSESGAGAVTYYESTGWRGIVERVRGSVPPRHFHSRPGEVFPLLHPLADVAAWRGAEVLEATSEDVLRAVALAVRAEGAVRLLVASIVARPQDVIVWPLHGAVALRRLNGTCAARACADPLSYRDTNDVQAVGGELALRLEPYEVVRIDHLGDAGVSSPGAMEVRRVQP